MAVLRTGEGLPDVVVTAVASTTALAADAEQTWQQLLEGRSGIRELDKWFVKETDAPVRIGGPITEQLDEHLDRVERRRTSYMQKMSTVLSRRLWEIAGSPEVDTRRLGVSVGLALGSTEEIPLQHDLWRQKGLRAVSPLTVQMYMPNGAAAAVGLDRQAKAGIISPVMADASGAAAIALGWRQIVLGEADVVICGGVETHIEAVPVAAFSLQELLSTDNDDPEGACRPFDRSRDGMVFGEGGALMLIETEEHARARGAEPLARLMSGAFNSDGYDVVKPEPSGERAGDALTRAIELAGLAPTDIDHINAHATGTVDGDLAEARAIRRALGDHKPAVYAPKAALGHSLGATGAIEAVLTVQALRDGVIPPTLNLKDLDPEIDLDVVAGGPRRGEYRYAVSNTFGLGGNNVSLVFGRY
ncbi:3-oxoacyl-(acyl-carrier-protein) synthase [Mycolicibacterium phlei]|jgi:beta-ketoacyl ACP synthase|uniref:3-oxoacyl-ACP synthase n=1 Tax=Mycolicibacterium phlei DSM 43239 = CCUG 21000 TaxID=1226750 RepID=A0A5N5VBL2_MYCPH|nr:KasA/KasB family beta-ketoacyl-ACP synthase [Mycolicibacterium phlei]VEG07991.1 3-oxoacyl-(acyl-carrier-protein) synthase [Mycobacteroides chelonae]AMO59865.1 3-oxoacyl-[acyl-carrier-protein] synthase 2 [Mycolicibacterium phlei]EID18200.1 3-oxoacyl-(acyl carrier protein) synthase II [Mycolicibacterium phlei RIVM601174]KAB7759311.1 3-oxoacyl-ACP synthase [Mycolicibacterium phlei DSM 43239 = CCUG 21000]KXW61047.1 3-oxoacyl-ACP synthase [Mycolicibacterium phlei DSM 43070]